MLWWDGAAGLALRNLQADERGSIVAVSDASGNPVGINAYDEYGVPQGGSITGKFGYAGQLWLPEIGLYYYKARMYDPNGGVFPQTDPIGQADNANLYAYVHNDPVNLVDPLGLTPVPEIVVTGSRILPIDPISLAALMGSLAGMIDQRDFSNERNDANDQNKDKQQKKPTKRQCIGFALKKDGLSLGLDIAGVAAEFALPEASVVASVIGSMYVGAAALGNSLAHKDALGVVLAVGGRHAGMAEGFFSGSALSFARTLSIGALALSTVRDIAQTKSDFESCMAGNEGP